MQLNCVCTRRLRTVSDSSLRKTHADQISVSSSSSSSSEMEDLSAPQPYPRLKLKVWDCVRVSRTNFMGICYCVDLQCGGGKVFWYKDFESFSSRFFLLLRSLSLSQALFTMLQRISPPCPPPHPDFPAPPAAPHIQTSALLLWFWTPSRRRRPRPHQAALLRPHCPSTTNRLLTHVSSESVWSVSAMGTSTRASW